MVLRPNSYIYNTTPSPKSQGTSKKIEDVVEEPSVRKLCFRIVSSGNDREAASMVLQHYGYLNKAQTVTVLTDLSTR